MRLRQVVWGRAPHHIAKYLQTQTTESCLCSQKNNAYWPLVPAKKKFIGHYWTLSTNFAFWLIWEKIAFWPILGQVHRFWLGQRGLKPEIFSSWSLQMQTPITPIMAWHSELCFRLFVTKLFRYMLIKMECISEKLFFINLVRPNEISP